MPRKDGFDIGALRARLHQEGGQRTWRSLSELAETAEFRQAVEREFPEQASHWNDSTSRRRFLQLMGASLALAGLQGCERQTEEKIVPYVTMPEHIVPGQPLYFATAMPFNGSALGLLVESHMGRPTKVEGNPLHPASPAPDLPQLDRRGPHQSGNPDQPSLSGATDIFAQAAVLGMYDPDRSQVVMREQEISTWEAFVEMLRVQVANRDLRLRVLTETVISPTLAAQLQRVQELFPNAQWHQWDPVFHDHRFTGAQLAFGRPLEPIYDLSQADAILSLDADFLSSGAGHLVYARQWATRRRLREPAAGATELPTMNRLYVAETSFTNTGAAADHRLALQTAEIEALARTIATRLGVDVEPAEPGQLEQIPSEWIDAVVDDLRDYRVRENSGSLVIAGAQQPPIVHALAHAINEQLQNVGRTVRYVQPVAANPVPQLESITDLVQAMRAGEVETLLILGANPAFTAPADLEFSEAMQAVPLRVHLGLEHNETARRCHWHLPEAHFLEAWGDARAFDGTVSVIQPLIAPLYAGKSAYELLAVLLGDSQQRGYDVVRNYWRSQYGGSDFEAFWQNGLHDGVLEGTQFQPEQDVTVELSAVQDALQAAPAPRGAAEAVEVVFRPDPTIWDGRFANNSWLQELSKPLTKLTWDNAALISADMAEKLGVVNEDMVEIQIGRRRLRMPVWILPGLPRNSISVHFGYGRSSIGAVGRKTGFDVYTIRTSEHMWHAPEASVRAVSGHYSLSTTQEHHLMGGTELESDIGRRHIVLFGTLEQYQANPHEPAFMLPESHERPHPSLYPEYEYEGYKWAMSIDMTACIGCNACVIACQAENNIPVVGKEEVSRSREMHWLRIDTYFSGRHLDQPVVHHQPVPCMHCEKAPCEPVCPVAATVHSEEGLNDMVYNRCVGTRYCSNNCPYKVRRFNFLDYADWNTPSYRLQRNPDVTVRSRGVMEKCTYCVQRISAGRIAAETRGGRIQDGDVVTACQAACPTEAIVFGDLNDPQGSRVAALREEPLNYSLLAHLNTKPRTTYLAAVRNPHPALQQPSISTQGHQTPSSTTHSAQSG